MDQQRERIQADLRGLVSGDVHCDDLFTQLYASDASVYEIRPLGVVRPRTSADVVATVKYAADHTLPLHARGAGTGLAGESLGPGLLLDFSHGMRRILHVGSDHVTVQPGVVLGTLNRYLASFGRLFGPDPAAGGVTTMGSVLALDSSGSQWLRYGSARRHVRSLQVVLADGESFEASRHPVTDDPEVDPIPRRRELVRRLAELIQREEAVIAAHTPRALVNRCGYHLQGILKDGQLDLAQLIVGSEGTLALITQATIHTEPAPKYRGLVALFFDRLESAAIAALEAVERGAIACDLVDRRILALGRDTDPRYARAIPRDTEAMLVVEQQGDDSRDVQLNLQEIALQIHRRRRLAFGFHLALAEDDYDIFRRLARRVSPMLYRLQGPERPTPFVEDLAVPPETLPDFFVRLQNVLKTHEVTASLFGHVGHGQLHIRPLLDLTNPAHVRKMQALAAELYEHVLELGGTISGEHGAGLSRTWFLKRQYGPLYDVFREVKRIFDPQNVLNPGKVIADVPQPITKNLRPTGDEANDAAAKPTSESGTDIPSAVAAEAPPAPEVKAIAPARVLDLHLSWTAGGLTQTAAACNGCGRCRTQSPEQRMCPIFRFQPGEEASPRAKANLMRALTDGRLDPALLHGKALKDIADLCVNCHQCRLECPAGVDIPKLMVECKAQYVASNGLDVTEWLLARLDRLAAWGMRLRPLANFAIGNRYLRWLLEKLTGIAQGRKLPRLAATSFIRQAQRGRMARPVKRDTPKVLYFVDVYANWFDVQLAEAFVAILKHNGIGVYVPADQGQSGIAQISLGDVERALPLVKRNVRVLADAIRQGHEIVTTEPAAAMALKHEYVNVLGNDDARLVAAHTHDASAYLWRLHEAGKLVRKFKPVNVTIGYHLPCHLKALDAGSPGESLLRLIPGLTVRRVERGCSGMAGTYGLSRQNYRSSLRAGWHLISAMRDTSLDLGVTECSACKLQMEQGTSKPTIHPLKLLALSYGVMPELEKLLTTRNEELIVT